jgi:O-antigen/teichoic acid export membrane protein
MSASASKKLGKAINKRTYFLLAGLIGLIAADFAYPLLDRNWILLLGLALFFLPVVAQIASRVRKRGRLDADRLKKTYSVCAVLLAGLVLMTFLNGAADRSPAQRIQTTVLHLYSYHGRSSSYRVIVPSWRSGRSQESLYVSLRTFSRLRVGGPVTVEVHGGLVGVPWYRLASPEN